MSQWDLVAQRGAQGDGAAGVLLGQALVTVAQTTVSNVFNDILGSYVSVDVGERPVQATLSGVFFNTVASQGGMVSLNIDAADIDMDIPISSFASGAARVNIVQTVLLTPGIHLFKARFRKFGTGTFGFVDNYGAPSPLGLQVVQV